MTILNFLTALEMLGFNLVGSAYRLEKNDVTYAYYNSVQVLVIYKKTDSFLMFDESTDSNTLRQDAFNALISALKQHER